MKGNVRPESMERITTKALADAFIEEQIKDICIACKTDYGRKYKH